MLHLDFAHLIDRYRDLCSRIAEKKQILRNFAGNEAHTRGNFEDKTQKDGTVGPVLYIYWVYMDCSQSRLGFWSILFLCLHQHESKHVGPSGASEASWTCGGRWEQDGGRGQRCQGDTDQQRGLPESESRGDGWTKTCSLLIYQWGRAEQVRSRTWCSGSRPSETSAWVPQIFSRTNNPPLIWISCLLCPF